MSNLITTKSVASELLNNKQIEDSSRLIENKNSTADKSVIPRNSEARDTRWSYFYVAATEWHWPLWFLIYFVWYLVFCTVRSIYNHQVSIDFLSLNDCLIKILLK